MKRKYAGFFFALLFFLPGGARAQCRDQLCSSIQKVLDEAAIDFRGYTAHTDALPDISADSAKIPCAMSRWANNVPMLICYAEVPLANAASWYARAMDALKFLSPSWHFNIKTSGESRYVDAGPPDCEPTPTEGPYIGQCPLHLEFSGQPGSSAKTYFIVNSFNSPYLLHRIVPASSAVKPVQPSPAKPEQPSPPSVSQGGCDEFCQDLKKAFEGRNNNYDGAPPDSLPGAKDCLVKKASSADTAKFVCYWQEASASAGETRFRDLVARLQVLVPSDWSSHQVNEFDEQTGVPLTAWHADDPGTKQSVRVYLSASAVALHITTSK
jgi:hypothetical protein